VTALAAQTVNLELGAGPQILIYHTHGSEAYTQTEENRYIESDSYRTIDCERNVVRVGEEMAQVFRAQGFEVIHDTTLYDYPAYSGAYERSRAGVEGWLAQYPSIRFILDVHRDALISQDGAAYKLVAQEGEQKVAQVMFVVGSSDGSTDHPNWRENLGLAIHLQSSLTQRYDELARPITLRSSRFNQHLSTGSLLVEVGGHGNTLEEAVEGGKLFARTVGAALKDMK
jgi:stage II sporulation protein P